MAAKIQKWGNSLGLRIPKSVIEQAQLKVNSAVDIEHKNGAIIITPIKNKISLDQLLDGINEKNLHRLEEDSPQGNEVW